MTEYINKTECYNAVDERINELREDTEFTIAKEICVNGVKRYIRNIPSVDVIEREKIDKAIDEIKDNKTKIACLFDDDWDRGIEAVLEIIKRNIGE